SHALVCDTRCKREDSSRRCLAPAAAGGGSDFYFLGMPNTPLENDLMNGMDVKPGVRYDLSAVDVAILTDVGWTERKIPKLPGDLNDDGVVSIADFIMLASNFGKT